MARRKRLTSRERAQNAKIKKSLQERGIIPPDKPRLNRRRFVEEAIQEWNGRDKEFYAWDVHLHNAISIMLGAVDKNFRVSPEAVGVAKCLRLAVRLREFHEKIKAEGRDTYTLREQIDYIRDILDA